MPARAAQDAALERGTAITDPATLRELDGGKFRLDRMLLPERSADIPLANSELFALPSMVPVRQAIDGEFDRYIARHGASLPKETIGVGEGFDFQLFDRTLLYSAETRFVLAGIVNRMDRTYAAEASCGEIRLIYRLTRMNKAAGDDASPPRLPMTLNLVLKAKGRGIHDHLFRNRQSLARRAARRDTVGKGWPARPDRAMRISTASRPISRSRMRRNLRFAISAPTIC